MPMHEHSPRPRSLIGIAVLATTGCLGPGPAVSSTGPQAAPPVGACLSSSLQGREDSGRLIIRRVYLERSTFRPTEGRIELDNAVVFESTDVDLLSSTRPDVIHDAELEPGPHELLVQYTLSGHGSGVHDYLNSYRFTVPSKYGFDVERGSATCVSVVLFFEGDGRTPLEQQPKFRFETEVNPSGPPPPSP